MRILSQIINYYSYIIFIYFFLINFFYIGLILISLRRLKEFTTIVKSDITVAGDYTKPISIIVPAYNEQETIIDNIQSLLKLEYPEFEVVVVNDGSRDKTLRRIIDFYDLRRVDIEINMQIDCNEIKEVYSSFEMPNLIVVNKENGGKSDALNAGINVSRYPLVCGIDADCVIEKEALLSIVKPFLKYEETIAVGGIVRIANGCIIKDGKVLESKLPKKGIVKFQIIEYLRAFLTSRVGWEKLNALLIISGAFGLFKKSAVVAIGGYKKTIGEDMELTIRLHEYFRKNKINYKVDYTSDAVCWTQVPDTLRGLKVQRTRWQRGLMDSLFKHRKMLLNPRYGAIGMLSLPYLWFFEMLGPIIELIGYIILIVAMVFGLLSKYIIFIFIAAYLYGILFSLCGILFEQLSYKRYKDFKEIGLLVLYGFLEQFYYRQFTVYCRIIAFFNYRKGSKQWGAIKRTSFTEEGRL